MTLFERRRFLMGANKSLLPSKYQQVEYIECTGTQYINTNFTPTGKLTITGKINLPKPNREMAVVGAIGVGYEIGFSTTNNRMFAWNDRLSPASVAVTTTTSMWNTDIEFTVVNDNDGSFRSLGINIENQYAENNTANTLYRQNLLLFNYRESYTFIGKCYSMKFYDDDILMRDFIPCYRKSDNVVGMYDLVEDKFHTNQGTGEFLKGGETLQNITGIGVAFKTPSTAGATATVTFYD